MGPLFSGDPQQGTVVPAPRPRPHLRAFPRAAHRREAVLCQARCRRSGGSGSRSKQPQKGLPVCKQPGETHQLAPP